MTGSYFNKVPFHSNTWTHLILVMSFILYASVSTHFVSGEIDDERQGNRLDTSMEHRKHLIANHHHRRIDENDSSEEYQNNNNNGDSDEISYNTSDESVEASHPQHLFAAYHESYITKETAEKFRNRIRLNNNKIPVTSKDYDDLLQEITMQQQKPKTDIFDKKYFDYLPADEIGDGGGGSDTVEIGDDGEHDDFHAAEVANSKEYQKIDIPLVEIEFEQLTSSAAVDEKTKDVEHGKNSRNGINGKRIRRDIHFQDSERFTTNEKRQAVWRQGFQQPLIQLHQMPVQNSQNPYVLPKDLYNNDLNPNNPWNNRFYGPSNLNNFYLPVPPPPVSSGYFYPRPQIPFAINQPGHRYHNVGSPPQNPPFAVKPINTPPTTVGPDRSPFDFENRFGEDSSTQGIFDDKPIWGFVDDSNSGRQPAFQFNQGNDIAVPDSRNPLPTSSNRRTTVPPLIHNSDDERPEVPRRRPQNSQGSNQPGTTSRPSPALIHNSDDPLGSVRVPPPRRMPSNSFGNNRQQVIGGAGNFATSSSNSGSAVAPIWSTGRIPAAAPAVRPISPAISRRPPQQNIVTQAPPGPSRCVWGIVNCCAPSSPAIRYACFERLGCNGAFWDLNPCSDFIYDAALGEADRYFD